jgi:ribonuclease T1
MNKHQQTIRNLAIALIVGAILAVIAFGFSGEQAPPPERGQIEQSQPESSGLPTIRMADLPPEARQTLQLIAQNGPFPYRRDGLVFENRERLLPLKPRGYYREYTVPTPGESDRGARRVVAGDAGERYYTSDHYASFRIIIE